MLKAITIDNQTVIFDVAKEQAQIRFALGKDWGPAPEGMEARHWMLEDQWKHSLPAWKHDFARNEKLEKLLVLQ